MIHIDKTQIEQVLKLRAKHPDRIPTYIVPIDKQTPNVIKNRFLVPKELKCQHLPVIIRQYLSRTIAEESALYIYNAFNELPLTSLSIHDMYVQQENRTDTPGGLLIIRYGVETAFGAE